MRHIHLRSLAGIVACAAALSVSGLALAQGAKQPDPESTVRAGFLGPAATMDPHKASQIYISYLLPFYDRLTQTDTDAQKVLPMLATSWVFSKDGKALTFTLRKDAKFHDGSPVNAAAVKASLDRAKTLQGSVVAQYLGNVASVDAVNPTTVRINLASGGGAELPALFASNVGAVINPSTFNADLDTNPPSAAGSGPYTVTRVSLPQQVEYERAGRHWDPTAGRARRLIISFPGTSANSLNGVRSGQLDIAQVSAEGMPDAMKAIKDGAVQGKAIYTKSLAQLVLNPRKPPFDNLALRQAVASAIDRNAIGEKLLGGYCKPDVQPLPVGDWSYDPKMTDANPYNPARSRALLAKMGPVPPFKLSYGTFAWFPALAEALQGMLADVGLKVELEPLSAAVAVPRLSSHDYAAFTYAIAGYADPSLTLSRQYLTTLGAARDTPFEPKIADLARKATDARLNQPQRAALYSQISGVINEQVLDIPLCQIGNVWVHSARLMYADTVGFQWGGFIDPRHMVIAK